jgi:hypothetical protein
MSGSEPCGPVQKGENITDIEQICICRTEMICLSQSKESYQLCSLADISISNVLNISRPWCHNTRPL